MQHTPPDVNMAEKLLTSPLISTSHTPAHASNFQQPRCLGSSPLFETHLISCFPSCLEYSLFLTSYHSFHQHICGVLLFFQSQILVSSHPTLSPPFQYLPHISADPWQPSF
ncbi:hypothetical protein V8G54_030632 [Vigna mungo]|uniref:Uncharacterized protein n=1 Tax=Vigna mungo TaxID=3915 RepID=A0AAQ3MWQ6_VIGMU